MSPSEFVARVRGHVQRTNSRIFFRRPLPINSDVPIVSFTFDDFPRSALLQGGAILKNYGAVGTYYASFGLLGKQSDTGTMFVKEDVAMLLEQGHELGCHTFGHCHAGATKPAAFEQSILRNRQALQELFPGVCLSSLSYPIEQPRLATKWRAARHFACCRGGGQTFNGPVADLNCLEAYFLEKSKDNWRQVQDVIGQNRKLRGWLIFVTHDIAETPTPWGCTARFFEETVRATAASGSRILPVIQAWQELSRVRPNTQQWQARIV